MPVIDFPTSPEGVRRASPSEILAGQVATNYHQLFEASLKMREALLFIKDFLINKENASSEGDFLRDIRREAHAPLHAKIDEALAMPDGKRP